MSELVSLPLPAGNVPEVRVDADVSGNTPTSIASLESARTYAGGTFDVDIVGFGLPVLGGFRLRFHFDSQYVQVAAADVDQMLTSTGHALCEGGLVYQPEIDPNSVLVFGFVGGPEGPPLASGDGVLARLTLTTSAPLGQTGLDVSFAVFADAVPLGPGICDWGQTFAYEPVTEFARSQAVLGEVGVFAPWTVNSTDDTDDLTPGDGVADADPALGIVKATLRAALQEANATNGFNDVTFRIPDAAVGGGPPWVISPQAPLPVISDATGGLNLDATTQPGVVIDGASAGPAAHGLVIASSSNRVTGLTINNFAAGAGVLITGPNASENVVARNKLGTDHTAAAAHANLNGVVIQNGAQENVIGGFNEADRNVISGNTRNGVLIQGADTKQNRIRGNFIGTDGSGAAALGNGEHGVRITDSASDNLVGGIVTGASNTIAFNGSTLNRKGHGVVVASGTENELRRNSIHSNQGRGIDLGDDSFTINDVGDIDTGANNLQNYAVVTKVSFAGAQKTIQWTLRSKQNAVFIIEFFSNDQADPSGFGEGRTYLRDRVVTTNHEGVALFTETFDAADMLISVTVTDVDGNTSEFSIVDTDGDALADAWETGGIDINEDGTADLELGSNPNHKDIFVEVDAMVGRVPDANTLPDVVAAFGAAPNNLVQNPDGNAGITLHAALDETNIPLAAFPNAFADFDVVKAARFGTAAQRAAANSANILAARRLVYHYSIFADRYGTTASSGLAEGGISGGAGTTGNDFMVTLGRAATPGGTRQQQAGAFMHELGHNLALDHGGIDVDNYKPNYHSVMNYLWTFPYAFAAPTAGQQAYQASWQLDYSRSAFPDLDESNLSEPVGIGGHAGHTVCLRVVGPCIPENGPVRWNGDADMTDVGLSIDINGDGNMTVLHGREDWSNLQYYFLESANFADGAHPQVPDEELLSSIGTVEQVHLFYNNSSFDGNDPAGNAADLNAIDTSKVPLEIGQMATFANITGYFRGINGVTYLLANAPAGGANITPNDFVVRLGKTNNVSSWIAGPVPTVTTLGNGRILLTFPDHSIQDTYVAISLLANAHTGLAEAHTAIFGNVRGDTGVAIQLQGVAFGRGAEDLLAMAQPGSLFQLAPVTSVTDVTKDGITTAVDFRALAVAGVNPIVLLAITPSFSAVGSPGISAALAIDEAVAEGEHVLEVGPNPNLPGYGSGPVGDNHNIRFERARDKPREVAYATFETKAAVSLAALMGDLI